MSNNPNFSDEYFLDENSFSILDSLPIGCFVWNSQYQIVYLNKLLLELLDISDCIDSESFFKCLPESDTGGSKHAEMVLSKVKQAFESGSSSFKRILHSQSGGERTCSGSLVRVEGKRDRFVIVYLLLSEETESQADKERAEHERFKIMLDSSPLCCHYRDEDFSFIDCNQKAVKLFGFSSKKAYMKNFPKLSPEFQPDGSNSEIRADELRKEALEKGYLKFEWVHQTFKGEPLPCEIVIVSIEHFEKKRLLVYMRDLREERAMITRMHESEGLARIMLDSTPLGCNLKDENLNLLECNQEALKLYGIPDKALYFSCYKKFYPKYQPDGSPSIERLQYYYDLAKEKGRVKFEWMYQTIDEKPIPCEVTIVRMKRNGQTIYASYIHDLREIRKTMSLLHSLEEKVYLDSLTEIYNRRYLIDNARKIFQRDGTRKMPISCIIFDIDFFKKVNDLYGHLAGDEVLKKIARLVDDELADSDIFVRYGGEEFVILLNSTDLQKACEVAEKIRLKIFNTPITYENREICISISLGVAMTKDGFKSLRQLIKSADNALYRAKKGGRNIVKYS